MDRFENSIFCIIYKRKEQKQLMQFCDQVCNKKSGRIWTYRQDEIANGGKKNKGLKREKREGERERGREKETER